MLRRHFLLSTAFVLSPFKPSPFGPLRHDFLVNLSFNDLSRLSVYSISARGVRIDHKINWYGEFFKKGQRRVVVVHTPDRKKLTIKETHWVLDGVVIGVIHWPNIKFGLNVITTHIQPCKKHKASTVITVDKSPSTVKEAFEYLAKSTASN